MQSGEHYDGGHIHLISQYVYYAPADEVCYDFYNNFVNASGCPAIATATHPSIDASIAAGTKPPSFHPAIDGLLRPFMPSNHRNLDDLMAAGTPLPFGHPPMDPYLCTNGTWGRPSGCGVNISGLHPAIDSSIGTGSFPGGHPLMDPLLREYMPDGHPDADDLMAADTPLPLGHPVLDSFVCRGPTPANGCADTPSAHPLVDDLLRTSERLPSQHPKVDPMLRDFLPEGHGDCDAYIADGTPIPLWHPNIDDYMCEPCGLSAGILLSLIVAGIFVLSSLYHHYSNHFQSEELVIRSATKRQNSVNRKMKLNNIVPDGDQKSSAVVAVPRTDNYSEVALGADEVDTVEDGTGDGAPAKMEDAKAYHHNHHDNHAAKPLPRRNLQLRTMETLHAQHRSELDLYPYSDRFKHLKRPSHPGRVKLAPGVPQGTRLKEKTSSLGGRLMVLLNDTRVPLLFSDWTLGSLLFVLAYLLLNVLCLYVACSSDFGRSWGSLAAANSMLLIIPAARNSILTAGLGLAFDHAVVYHRFLGRFAVLCVLVHGWYFLDYVNRARFAFVTGVAALGCGLVIFLTSVNYVRRNLFNLFYWSHYSFVGYLVLAYLHVPQTQPFMLAGGGLYVADKLLRWLWMLWPHQTMVFRPKGDSIAQVRFPKNPITRCLEMHHVGQYYFVNFPELSLSEWHPFSVSSGPREASIEMHIRALGDHTDRIVALAKDKAKTGESTTILIDGPYGQQNFNYRRYPMILLAAGGIGVTPTIGMMKDIYDVGLGDGISKFKSVPQPNAIETIYFLWAMQKQEDYECFREDIEQCIQRSKDTDLPTLVPLIYITRSTGELEDPFIAGRPQLADVFERMMYEHNEDQTGLVFACGPQPLVAELWDKSIEHTINGREIDFHHEVFEF